MEAGIDSPVNRSIIHLLRSNKSMLYSELLRDLGMDNTGVSPNIHQLMQKNIVNREIYSSLLVLNKPFIKDKGFLIKHKL